MRLTKTVINYLNIINSFFIESLSKFKETRIKTITITSVVLLGLGNYESAN